MNASALRTRLLAHARRASARFEAHADQLFAVALALYFVRAAIGILARPVWFDELLGLAAATAPTLRDLFSALALPVDINPPLHHLLLRVSVSLFGDNAWALRLPSALAMAVFFSCLFALLRRRLGASTGVLGVLVVMCMPQVAEFGWEGRPYAFVLAFTAVAMLAYQRYTAHRGMGALATLLIALAALPLTHYYALLIVAPFIAAELVRALNERRIDRTLWVGAALTLACALLVLAPLALAQRRVMGHYHSQPSLMSFVEGYTIIEISTWILMLALAGLSLSAWLGRANEVEPKQDDAPEFAVHELALAVGLLLLPLLGLAVAKPLHAYVPRYFLAASAGCAVVAAVTLGTLRRALPAATMIVSAALLLGVVANLGFAYNHRHDGAHVAKLAPLLAAVDTPILLEDPKDYLLLRRLMPELAPRLYYAADAALAYRLTGTDTDDKLMRALSTLTPQQSGTLDDIASTSSRWLVVPGRTGWLVPCLRLHASGTLQLFQPTPAQRKLAGASELLYEAHLPAPGANWCAAE